MFRRSKCWLHLICLMVLNESLKSPKLGLYPQSWFFETERSLQLRWPKDWESIICSDVSNSNNFSFGLLKVIFLTLKIGTLKVPLLVDIEMDSLSPVIDVTKVESPFSKTTWLECSRALRLLFSGGKKDLFQPEIFTSFNLMYELPPWLIKRIPFWSG